MEQFLAVLRQAGPARLFAALGVTGLVAAALIAIMLRVGSEERALLYANLPAKDAAAIAERLDAAAIPYEVSPDGTTIRVARSRVGEVRVMLAGEGLPATGSVGYEIFDSQDALGATSFVQNINRVRALEGELARTVASLDPIKEARVHLVIPERRLFEDAQETPTASIVVGLEGARLTPRQVLAIRNLAAAAVPGLQADRVTLLDERGELLAGATGDGADAGVAMMDDRKAAAEERIRATVTNLVESIAGPGAARVQVAVEMDMNSITEQSERFDPDGVVTRSTETIEENNTSAEREQQGVTVGANVPDGGDGANAPGSQTAGSRTQETVNNEVSKTTRTEITPGGRIARISVAVAVDGTMAGTGAQAQWRARSPEEMERITALVRSAVGFDEERGDKVEVVNIRFAKPMEGAGTSSPSPFEIGMPEILRIAEIVSLALVALILALFVARPLIKGLVAPPAGSAGVFGAPGLPGLPGVPGVAGAPALAGVPSAAALPGPDGIDSIDEQISVARIQGDMSAATLRQVAEVVDSSPERTVAIIRGWMNERR